MIKYEPKPEAKDHEPPRRVTEPELTEREDRAAGICALRDRAISAEVNRANGDTDTAEWLESRIAEIASEMELRDDELPATSEIRLALRRAGERESA